MVLTTQQGMKDCEPSLMKNWLWKDKMYGMLFDESFLYRGKKHTSKSGRQSTFQKFTVPFLPLSNYLKTLNWWRHLGSVPVPGKPPLYRGREESSGAFPHFFRMSGSGREPSRHCLFLHSLGSPLRLPALAVRSWLRPHKERKGGRWAWKGGLEHPLLGSWAEQGKLEAALVWRRKTRRDSERRESVSGEGNPWVGESLCLRLKMFR